LNNVPYWETYFIESLKSGNITMERFKRDSNYKDHQRCLLIEKWRKSTSFLLKYAQMTASFTILSFSFYREDNHLGCPNGYSRHTITRFFHMEIVD